MLLGTSMLLVFLSELSLIITSIFYQKDTFLIANIFVLLSYTPVFYLVLKQILQDFAILTKQIIYTVIVGLLIIIQFMPFITQIVKELGNPSGYLNNYSQMDIFLFIMFIGFDLALFLLIFILFSIYTKRAQHYWLILIIAYLVLSISDNSFFYYLISKSYFSFIMYMIFNMLHVNTIFIGILIIKANLIEFRTIEEIEQENIRYRSLYEEIDRLNKHRVIFTNILKQDLNNDIAVIEAAFEMYTESGDRGFQEMAKERLERVREKIFTMGVVEGFLVEEKVKPIDLKIIYGAVSAFENVRVIYPEKEIFVKANRFLFSIFYGLILNAFQHAGERVKVEVEVVEERDYVLVHVRDNGVGIPDREKNLIFTRDYARSNKGGMNLFLIKITLDTFGGEIHAKDNYPKGTDMVVKLEKLYTDAL